MGQVSRAGLWAGLGRPSDGHRLAFGDLLECIADRLLGGGFADFFLVGLYPVELLVPDHLRYLINHLVDEQLIQFRLLEKGTGHHHSLGAILILYVDGDIPFILNRCADNQSKAVSCSPLLHPSL